MATVNKKNRQKAFAQLLSDIEVALEEAPFGDANSIVDKILDDSVFKYSA